MSANILRASIRRNAVISNKRFYSTVPPSEQPVKPGPGVGGYFLAAAAAGVGYYLYRRSADINSKAPIVEKGENVADEVKAKYEKMKTDASQAAGDKVDAVKSKYEEEKGNIEQAVRDKVDDAKSNYEEGKANASAKVDEIKKDGTDKYEAVKDTAAQKGQEIQKNVGEKVTDAGKSIKDNA